MGRTTAYSLIAAGTLLLTLPGCQRKMQTPINELARGEFSQVRLQMQQRVDGGGHRRDFLLDRLRLGVPTLADGYAAAAQLPFEEAYHLLRTQGLNRDKTLATVVLHEGVRIWKGEPFEQAMGFLYYGLQQASLSSWDNARAAAGNALFHLRDFSGEGREGQAPLDVEQIARRARVYEEAAARGEDPDAALARLDDEDFGYVVRESNFTLAYLLNAIANQNLGRDEEASDNFNRVIELDPRLRPLVERFRRGGYNTVLVVSYGLGPEKVSYGPDDSLARFDPRTLSDDRPLIVSVDGAGPGAIPWACDLNAMARSHLWNQHQDLRQAKSTAGTVLLYGGAVAAGVGADRGSNEALIAGLSAAAAGLLLKAGSAADLRHLDVLPQRFYVVPLQIDSPQQKIQLQVQQDHASRLILTGLGPPDPRNSQAQLRYVRLLTGPAYHQGVPDWIAAGQVVYDGQVTTRTDRPPAWATSGRILYANDYTPATGRRALPFILGGACVRSPSERVLSDYQRAGHLRNRTLADLLELYRLEGVTWQIEDTGGRAGRHVLEGGRSLVAPLPGTAGYARLFGQVHPPYEPRSREVRQAANREQRRAANRPLVMQQ